MSAALHSTIDARSCVRRSGRYTPCTAALPHKKDSKSAQIRSAFSHHNVRRQKGWAHTRKNKNIEKRIRRRYSPKQKALLTGVHFVKFLTGWLDNRSNRMLAPNASKTLKSLAQRSVGVPLDVGTLMGCVLCGGTILSHSRWLLLRIATKVYLRSSSDTSHIPHVLQQAPW